jgi:deoxyribodipyrimidine photo-lyase
MVVASFLTKHLMLDWRMGESYFMQQLIDGDLASNAGGWQWVAGTGVDASPFFRIFNPVLQGKRFDPSGTYISRWVPELRGYDARWIHEPWKAPFPPHGYPQPMVDHHFARLRALDAYREIGRR